MNDLPRIERAAEAARLRKKGLLQRQIADRMGVSRTYVSALLRDPTGELSAARKRGYGKPCRICGSLTDGSNGRAKAPELCRACFDAERVPEHGTLGRYRSGCGCDECRRANRDHMRSLKGAPPPNHSYSGYINYGCRCDVCRQAHSDYLWLTDNSKYGRRRRAAA